MNKKTLIIFAGIILIVTVGVYYFSYQAGYLAGFESAKELTQAKAEGEEEEIDMGNIVSSPLEKMPSINPLEKVINPFKGLYKNPFK